MRGFLFYTLIMSLPNKTIPDHTAIRTALWRALHVHIDPEPHVLSDTIGEELVAEENWRARPDMAPDFSKNMRASIVGRARLIEDLVEEQLSRGVDQYVLLGAGLDTFTQRRPDLEPRLQIYEIDQPETQSWKQRRLIELGYNSTTNLHFVPVNFETGEAWPQKLITAGFDKNKPATVVSTGVSMYLSLEANLKTFSQVTKLAPGTIFATTFMLSLDLLDDKERSLMEFVMNRAKESGTPFLSLFSPNDIISLAKKSGFKEANYVSGKDIYEKYFSKRTDGLRAGNAEAFLVAKV